jgi:hypothetical protein
MIEFLARSGPISRRGRSFHMGKSSSYRNCHLFPVITTIALHTSPELAADGERSQYNTLESIRHGNARP